MAKLQGFKRIQAEDFPKEFATIVDRLGYSINVFAEQIIDSYNKKISYENLNRSCIFLNVNVAANGTPNDELIVRPSVTGLLGFICVSAENLTDTTLVTSQPFLSYIRLNNGTVRITSIIGLPANKDFRLTLEILGT